MAMLNIKENQESDIPPLPVGTYPGVISGFWDIGTQKNEYQGEVSYRNQFIIRVEVSKKIEAEGQYNGKRYAPMAWVTIPKAYSDKSTLVKIACAAMGKTLTANDFASFDTDCLIGKNVCVTIQHTSGGKAKITGFSPAMDGMPIMEPELEQQTPEWVTKLYNKGLQDKQSTESKQELPPVDSYNNMPQVPLPEDGLPF